jgi:hypothetical protein
MPEIDLIKATIWGFYLKSEAKLIRIMEGASHQPLTGRHDKKYFFCPTAVVGVLH